MAVLYYECFAGISGDMNLAALIDLGVDLPYLHRQLAKLNLPDQFDLNVSTGQKNSIYGCKVDVVVHSHQADGHDHAHGAARTYKQIVELIESSALSQRVKRDSIAIFEIIARAEAKMHNIDYLDIHFHEVGALDSIIDIVATAICMDYLDVDKIVVSDIEVGSGFVDCAHGKLPIPAPATAEILLGYQIVQNVKGYEMTTPTGAAIIKHYADRQVKYNLRTGKKIGYGLGTHDSDIPNFLRVTLLDVAAVTPQILIESNVDDQSPEKLSFVQEQLFELGARDVFLTPIAMKKGRLASKLSVLIDAAQKQAALALIFKHSSAIGARVFDIEKVELDRKTIRLKTDYGELPVKLSYDGDDLVNYKAAYEACRTAALEHGVSLAEIDQAVSNALSKIGLC